jgi:predicted RecA/RadA family phage recombinase
MDHMKNQIQHGDAINVPAPAGGIVSGNGYLFGNMFGIAAINGAQGDIVPLWLVGCYTLNKNAAEAWNIGDEVYWDNTAKLVTTNGAAGGNTKIGIAIAGAANPSSSGNVRLNGSF